MKKYTLLMGLMLIFSMATQAQVDEEVPVLEEVEIEEVEAPGPPPELSPLEQAESGMEGAKSNLADAQEAYNQARQALLQAENDLNAARSEHRLARRALNEERKRENPFTVDRYQVNVNPVLSDMSKGSNYGYTVFLEGSEGGGVFKILSKNAESEFKKFMSEYKAGRVKKTKGELFFDNILVPQVSSYNLDLYTDFEKQDNGVNMITYWNIGDGFINGMEASSADEGVRQLLDKFARHMRQLELQNQLQNEEKEMEKIQKDIEKHRGKSADSKARIQKEEAAIAESMSNEDAGELLLEQQMDKMEITRKKLDKVN